MQKNSYEIEIKSLLGGKEKADALVEKMKLKDPDLKTVGSHKQLNHYFVGGDLKALSKNVESLVEKEKLAKLQELAEKATDFSVRTRWADGRVILVLKASVDDTTSSNGTARLEWEALVPASIEELDALVLKSGFTYQAKWSRERSDYVYNGANVSIDKNAGYGYLAEFEKVIDDQTKATEVKEEIRKMMAELDVVELAQDRLARMFDHYNHNWESYYGTDKIFNIE